MASLVLDGQSSRSGELAQAAGAPDESVIDHGVRGKGSGPASLASNTERYVNIR
jgi:hypothetical protein